MIPSVSISTLLSRLRKGGSRAGRAATIISEAQSLGYSDSAAINIAVIAAAESNFNPNAYHPDTGAIGYFQMVPKYWEGVASATTTPARLRAQLRIIRKKYGDNMLDDLPTFYARHFYPGLGIAYRQYRTFGIAPGRNTFGQYAVIDLGTGAVFHSPIVNAIHCWLQFVSATRVDPEYNIPSLPLVMTSVSLSGREFKQSTTLTGPFEYTTKTRFDIGRGQPVTVSRLDPAIGAGGGSDHVPSFEKVKWELSRSIVQIEVSDEAADLSDNTFLVPFYDALDTSSHSIISVPQNILMPSFDSLVQRMRDGEVDLEIIKFCLLGYAGTIESLGDSYVREKNSVNGRIIPAETFARIAATLRSDADCVEFLTSKFGTETLYDVLSSLLSYQMSGSSLNGKLEQLSLHSGTSVVIQVAGEDIGVNQTGADRIVNPAEVENFRDRWFIQWLQYSGVLFPFSLLVTPSFGSLRANSRAAISQRYAWKLLTWAEDSVADSGSAALKSALSSFSSTRSSNSPRVTRKG